MKTQHTPGPWTVGEHHSKAWVNGPDDDGAPRVADCGPDDPSEVGWVDGEQRIANAILIGAAPDLLAALRDILAYVPEPEDDTTGSSRPVMRESISRALAAIARAEGRPA